MAAVIFSLLVFFISLFITTSSSLLVPGLQILHAERQIDLTSHIVRVYLTLKVLLAFPPAQFDHLSLVKAAVTVGKKRKKSYVPLEVNPTEQPDAPNGTKYYTISLLNPLLKGEITTLEILYILSHSLEPFPAEISQSESQLVYYHDSAIILSPYHIKQQATLVKTPTNKVESFTQVEPTFRSGTELKYGPYEDRNPYSYSPIIVHFENNNPFAVVEELEREIEVSHWGSVQVTERYKLAHAGAKHKGVFSRVEYQSRPTGSGVSSFKHLLAELPPRVHSVYYRDDIGNISSSRLRINSRKSELLIEPRYPLFGGWKSTFVIGYGVPLQDFLFESAAGARYLNYSFGCPLADTVVVLPEGSKDPSVEVPFAVEQSLQTKYSYLDVIGRTVVVLEKNNVVPEHNVPFQNMGMAESEGKMKGWLYMIRYYRFGLQYSRKRYFILEDNCLKSFKSIPTSETEEPLRSAIIDSCIRVVDNGRESHHRKLFFIFTLYNTSNHNDRLKDAALNPGKDLMSYSKENGSLLGLRLFKEAKDRDSNGRHWDDHPAIMAVGVIDGASESVFRTLMSLGTSRTEAMKRRDFLLRRYWRREDDGTYVILYHSVFHRKCPPQDGYVRACLKIYVLNQAGGGYLITPIQQALRELFRAKSGNTSHEYLSGDIGVPESEKEKKIKPQVSFKRIQNETDDVAFRQCSGGSSLMALSDAADEFFDVPEPSDDEGLENGWHSNTSPEFDYVDSFQPKISSAANFVKKIGLAVQKKGYMDLQEVSREESVSCCYGSTLPKDSSFNMPCSWATADPSSFLIRGDNYLVDNLKVKAKGTLLQMVGADWLRSDKREDDLAGRYGSIVQVWYICSGSSMYNLAILYAKNALEETPLLERFVNGDDAFRNSRFKLIPYISKGSWIVKQSVGKKSCLVGQALEVNYFRGKNYLELGIDVGSSTVARGVVSLVLGYLNNLVIEMAFLIQGNTAEELPEFLLERVALTISTHQNQFLPIRSA
ncbi:hypothetical protein DH2020_021623 [Rehmannia glutinosa]|uniref:Dolichyl-diphosphooligosaccharide--protein glycosyltransferase subunit 1 n=1 Tax=Rehmannia glutinosa TaxID=99300 RepID=A0ABR0WB01_REHGL